MRHYTPSVPIDWWRGRLRLPHRHSCRCLGLAWPAGAHRACDLRIVPRSRNPRYPLGFAALPIEKEKIALQASVFFEAAEGLAAGYPTSKAQMLGYILAHEIGHLLLGEGNHSGKGIMRTPWRKQEMDDAAKGTLGFTAKQAKRMKADLLARARADRAD